MNLPAGLIDNRLEFFNDPADIERSYCLTGGVALRVRNSTPFIKDLIREDMLAHPEKFLMLLFMGYLADDDQLEKYSSCVFGGYDGLADMVNGKLQHTEYWPCPQRHTCPGADILCNRLKLPYGTLSTRQVEVLKLVGECLLNKEIADQLQLSIETVKIHIRNIQEKAGLMNKKDLVKLAYLKNLIS